MKQSSFFSSKFRGLLPGIIIAVAIAAGAKLLGIFLPLIGSILIAIVIGVVIKNTVGIPSSLESGLNFTVKKLLKFAVILLGVSLNLQDVLVIGKQSLLVIFVSVCSGIILTVWFGKLFKLDKTLTLMIGVGTSICGATAISAVKGILNAKENETAYAISTIVFFNLIAFFVYPIIGHFFHFDEIVFGIWAGTAVHDTSSAVAVGYVYGNEAGEAATTVKLARTLFLLPLIMLIPILTNNVKKGNVKNSIKKAFPWFIVWFLAVSLVNSAGWIPEIFKSPISDLSKFLITMVMAAVGLQVNLKQFSNLGFKPLITGLFASVCVSVISLLMISLFL